jgi:type VI secretion system protein ImpE
MNALEHFQSGNLREAIPAALEEVRRQPADGGKRTFLCELLCFAGDLERADRQLDALGQQNPQGLSGVNLFRQLIRAELARQQFYSEGRLPDFLGQEVTPVLRGHLEASILLREGKAREAAELLGRLRELAPRVSGTCNGQAFDELRDLDDLTASFFEVLTVTGRYFWVPLERVESTEFHAPERPLDLLWRRAHMIVRGGPDGEVFLPVLYAGSAADPNDKVRLGRMTEWRGDAGAPVRGFGQRMFLVGSEDCPILELQTLTIHGAEPGQVLGK